MVVDVVVMHYRVVLGIEGAAKVAQISQGQPPERKMEEGGIRAFGVAFVGQKRMLKMVLSALEAVEFD